MIWRRRAEEDLIAAYLFLGENSRAAAERLLDAVEGAIQFLVDNPSAGRLREFRSPRARGIRSWVVRRFQTYLIFYRAIGKQLEVVRLVHGARDIPRLLEEES